MAGDNYRARSIAIACALTSLAAGTSYGLRIYLEKVLEDGKSARAERDLADEISQMHRAQAAVERAKTDDKREIELVDAAKLTAKHGDPALAESYAHELLRLAGKTGGECDWNHGNAVHDGNMVLGLVALGRQDVAAAKAALLAAGKTPGSPQLNSFGPNMSLAKALLEAGERVVVLEYFALCRLFWKGHRADLDDWSAEVKEGGIPDFGANLVF
jgi:hypothetical protein